jgi:hypothetical protein
MPLTQKGKTIKRAMEKEYGKEKGKKVFYASENKGTISGIKKKIAHKMRKNSQVRRIHRQALGKE